MSSRKQLRQRLRRRGNTTQSTLSQLTQTADKFNFTATIVPEQFTFGSNAENAISSDTEMLQASGGDSVEDSKVGNATAVNTEEKKGAADESKMSLKAEEKDDKTKDKDGTNASPFLTMPRSLISSVSTKNIELLDEMLEENKTSTPGLGSADQMNHALMLAVTMKETIMTEKLLQAGANLHAFDSWYPILLTAVDIKAFDVFEMLVKHCKDINVSSNYGNLMHSAARSGNMDFLKRVYDLGVDINFKCKASGSTPLHEAVKCVKFNGKAWLADLKNPEDDRKRKRNAEGSCLDIAKVTTAIQAPESVSNYDLEPIKFLVEKQSVVDEKDDKGRTALHEASFLGNTEVVQFLLDSGASPSIPDNSNCLPIMYALQHNHSQVAKLLIDRTEIDKPVSGSEYIVHLACKSGSLKCLQYLIERKANLRVKDATEGNKTPLMLCIHNKVNSECIKLLLSHDCGINEIDDNEQSALHILLSEWNHMQRPDDLLSLLVQSGADVNMVNTKDETPIMTWTYDLDRTENLLANGANTDYISKNGDTVLLKACVNQRPDAVKLLLQHNMNLRLSEVVRSEGEYKNLTALQISVLYEDQELTELLLASGASLRNMQKWIKESTYCQELRQNNDWYAKAFTQIEKMQHGTTKLEDLSRLTILKALGTKDTAGKAELLCLPSIIKSRLPWEAFITCRTQQLQLALRL